jgi:hypothetical protein
MLEFTKHGIPLDIKRKVFILTRMQSMRVRGGETVAKRVLVRFKIDDPADRFQSAQGSK